MSKNYKQNDLNIGFIKNLEHNFKKQFQRRLGILMPKSTIYQKIKIETKNLVHLEKYLGLKLEIETENMGNVCMINATEVRDDYKQSFTIRDLFNGYYANMHLANFDNKLDGFFEIEFHKSFYLAKVDLFWKYVKLGKQLKALHQLKFFTEEKSIAVFSIAGHNKIDAELDINNWDLINGGTTGKIWINQTQYFNNIPVCAWAFNFDGKQLALKWLKDRREKFLSVEEILQYQKLIVVLNETYQTLNKFKS